MTHFAIISPPLTGHIHPMLAISRELVSRGHRVTVIHQMDVEPLIDVPGVAFAMIGADTHPAGSLAEMSARMGCLGGLLSFRRLMDDLARQTEMFCGEAPAILEQIGAEFVIADQLEPAGGLIARHLGLPYVSVATALHLNREPDVPPVYVGWGYNPSEHGRKRNMGGYQVSDFLMRRVNNVIRRYAREWDLGPLANASDCLSPLAQLAQGVAGVDFPRRGLPTCFHYVGPIRQPLALERPFDFQDDGRPMVYCSLGTLQGGRIDVFRAVAEACRDLDLQLVITHLSRMRPEDAATLAGHPHVFADLPQRGALQRASLVVTHAGFNTTMDTLAAGLPMVAIPIAFEQGAIAARIRRAGVGEIVRLRRLSAAAIRRALVKVRDIPTFRHRAEQVRDEIARAGGSRAACDIIEGLSGVASERRVLSLSDYARRREQALSS